MRTARELAWPDLIWSHFSRPRFGDFDERVAAASAAGFDGIGLYSPEYRRLRDEEGRSAADLRQILARRYADEPFVRLLAEGQSPATRHVRGANHCLIGVFADRVPGRAILLSAIDNLVKGASGQAVQNMNLMFGLPETAGLTQVPVVP